MSQIKSIFTPQPGAKKNALLTLSLPPNKDVTAPDDPKFPGDPKFPTLTASDAVNFGPGVKPIVIEFVYDDKSRKYLTKFREWISNAPLPYTGLYRVWGDPAWDVGSYWSVAAPIDEDSFYGSDAVEYSWNSARYVTHS